MIGQLKEWKNKDGDSVVVMQTEDNKYVVVHGGNMLDIGTYVEIDDSYKAFIGTVNMVSKEGRE